MDTRIEIAGVTKEFTLRHRRSLKELVVAAVRRQDLGINTFKALDGVTFDVHQGETVALLGFNGSGKSTLLKLISGVLRPDGGRVQHPRQAEPPCRLDGCRDALRAVGGQGAQVDQQGVRQGHHVGRLGGRLGHHGAGPRRQQPVGHDLHGHRRAQAVDQRRAPAHGVQDGAHPLQVRIIHGTAHRPPPATSSSSRQ